MFNAIRQRSFSFFEKWTKSEDGASAVIYALCIIPMMMMIGFSIDTSRIRSSKTVMQSALDTAALGAGKMLADATLTDAEVTAAAIAIFKENDLNATAQLDCPDPLVEIDRVTSVVKVSNNCNLPMIFGGFFAKDSVNIAESSSVTAGVTRLDLALMLDVSGSMKGQKIEDLKAAAKQAADRLITPASGDRVRLAFNTYSTSLNAGEYAADALGLTGYTLDTIGGVEVLVSPDGSDVRRPCVSERETSQIFTDAEPDVGQWIGDKATDCPVSSILPLTSDVDKFKNEIDTLEAGGWTAGHIGTAWAWYLISPEWSDIWPATSKPHGYTEPDTVKAVILMTDGSFNTVYDNGLGDSSEQSLDLCENMIDRGVLVYSVAFKAPTDAKKTLEDCAGDPSRFFDATSGAELKAAYDKIASQLSKLALTD